jgi:hypothetical protein
MNCLKTSFAIALLSCFLTIKTTAQVGLTVNNMRQSVVIKSQKQSSPTTAIDLKLPKYFNESAWFKIQSDFVYDPTYYATNAIHRYNQSIIIKDKSMSIDFRNNALNAVLSRNATVLERVVGTTLLLLGN